MASVVYSIHFNTSNSNTLFLQDSIYPTHNSKQFQSFISSRLFPPHDSQNMSSYPSSGSGNIVPPPPKKGNALESSGGGGGSLPDKPSRDEAFEIKNNSVGPLGVGKKTVNDQYKKKKDDPSSSSGSGGGSSSTTKK